MKTLSRVQQITENVVMILMLTFILTIVGVKYIEYTSNQSCFRKWAFSRFVDGLYFKYWVPVKNNIWLLKHETH